jgi:hypothetical protein
MVPANTVFSRLIALTPVLQWLSIVCSASPTFYPYRIEMSSESYRLECNAVKAESEAVLPQESCNWCPDLLSTPESVQFADAAVDVTSVEDSPAGAGVVYIAAYFALHTPLTRPRDQRIGKKREPSPAAVLTAHVSHIPRRTHDEIVAGRTPQDHFPTSMRLENLSAAIYT